MLSEYGVLNDDEISGIREIQLIKASNKQVLTHQEEQFLFRIYERAKMRKLFYSIGITDDNQIERAVEQHGSNEIERRIRYALNESGLDHPTIKRIFAIKPELVYQADEEGFRGQLEMVRANNAIIDGWAQNYSQGSSIHRQEEVDESMMARRIENYDVIMLTIRNILWETNVRLVHYEASNAMRKLQRRKEIFPVVDIQDLISEGNFGLKKAIEGFDWKMGLKFSTYGGITIRRHIWREVFQKEALISLPEHCRLAIDKMLRFKEEYFLANHKEATLQEISVGTGTTVKMIKDLLGYGKRSTPKENDEGEMDDPIARLPATDGKNAVKMLITEELNHIVDRFIDRLTPIEQDVILRRFGLRNEDEMTLEEIGQRYGRSREWMRQIEDRAMFKLTLMARKHGIESNEFEDI